MTAAGTNDRLDESHEALWPGLHGEAARDGPPEGSIKRKREKYCAIMAMAIIDAYTPRSTTSCGGYHVMKHHASFAIFAIFEFNLAPPPAAGRGPRPCPGLQSCANLHTLNPFEPHLNVYDKWRARMRGS